MQDIFPERIRMIQGVILFSLFLFASKLIYIQLIDVDNKVKAKNNAIKEIIDYPSRGLIYDRNLKLVVHNHPIYEILVTPLEVEKNIDTHLLCQDLGILPVVNDL